MRSSCSSLVRRSRTSWMRHIRSTAPVCFHPAGTWCCLCDTRAGDENRRRAGSDLQHLRASDGTVSVAGVIAAKAGINSRAAGYLDSRLRGNDNGRRFRSPFRGFRGSLYPPEEIRCAAVRKVVTYETAANAARPGKAGKLQNRQASCKMDPILISSPAMSTRGGFSALPGAGTCFCGVKGGCRFVPGL